MGDLDQTMSEWSTPEGIDRALSDLNQVSADWQQIKEFAPNLAKIQYV